MISDVTSWRVHIENQHKIMKYKSSGEKHPEKTTNEDGEALREDGIGFPNGGYFDPRACTHFDTVVRSENTDGHEKSLGCMAGPRSTRISWPVTDRDGLERNTSNLRGSCKGK